MADGRVAGQRALVTGASSGIGMEIARVLAREGADLVLVARRKDRLESLADELRTSCGVDIVVEAADLLDPATPIYLFDRTEGAGVAIDILVNNAGIGTFEPFVDTPWDTLASQIQLSTLVPTHLCHLFAPRMVERGRGHIMNLSSMASFSPTPGYAAYGGAKAFIRQMTVTLEHELRGTGVHAIAVCPGGVTTEFSANAGIEITKQGETFMMPADECARISVDKMLARRSQVVPGFSNAFGVWLLRFIPTAWQPALAAFSMRISTTKTGNSS